MVVEASQESNKGKLYLQLFLKTEVKMLNQYTTKEGVFVTYLYYNKKVSFIYKVA